MPSIWKLVHNLLAVTVVSVIWWGDCLDLQGANPDLDAGHCCTLLKKFYFDFAYCTEFDLNNDQKAEGNIPHLYFSFQDETSPCYSNVNFKWIYFTPKFAEKLLNAPRNKNIFLLKILFFLFWCFLLFVWLTVMYFGIERKCLREDLKWYIYG